MNKKIIIISGDPNSINSEIIYKCWKKLNKNLKSKVYLIANKKLLEAQFKILNYKIKLHEVKSIDENIENLNTKQLKVINISINFKNPFNVSKKIASNFVIKSIELGHKLALRKDVLGIINCPIRKELLKRDNNGVTEYLASKCGVKNNKYAMLIMNNNLAVCPITTHIDIKKITKKLNKNIIFEKIKLIDNWFIKFLNFKPKIGILGLNPHNAELKKNSEEKKYIIPVINKLKKLKYSVKGPLVADTLFINDYKNFDVIIGMYHDQVLTPFKTLYKFNAINLTAGLKYLRVSPDHGVAKNLIRKNKANFLSLFQCVSFIFKLAK